MVSVARLRAVFAGRPRQLSVYVWLVVVTGAVLVGYGFPRASFEQPLLFVALLLGSMTAAVLKIHLPLSSGQATLSMSYFTDFLSLVLLGPDEAMLVAAASAATQSTAGKIGKGRFSLRQTLFSSASLVITIQAAGLVANRLGGFDLLDPSFPALARPAAAGAATFFLCNSWLVATAVALSRGRSVVTTWRQDFLWAGPACFVAAGAATFAAAAMLADNTWLIVFATALLGLTFHAYRVYLGRVSEHQEHARVVQNLHLATVEALARAIDARDQTIDPESGTAENHIRRVEACAASLGEAAGMAPNEIEGLKIASLLHDIGKLAVPEHILTKPGRLTPAEFDYIRLHPTVGANIIRAVPFPYPVAPYIQSHHERWDGTGYPEGLKGDDIPLGARVLAVVDYYDAITAHRPYHRAMAPAEAIETIKKEAGKALDPRLVDLFIDVIAQSEQFEATERASIKPDAPSQRTGAPATGFSTDGSPIEAALTVYQSISQATQEVRALYDIAVTLGTRLSVEDTMSLLTSKLNRLVPASCWALYLPDGRRDAVRCKYAFGLSAIKLQGLTIGSGEGVTGWAARHLTAAINARASSDFDAAGVPEAGALFKAALAFPLLDNGQLVGILTAYHEDAQPYTEAHLRLLERLSSQAASVLANSIQFEGMRAASLTDSLTDLPNSRALIGYLDERLADSANAPVPSALIMIDLDNFKAINDVHGHQIGDLALQTLAGTLRRQVRSTDFCARYGGDEFVVALACQDRTEAERRAVDLQRAVGRQRIVAPDGTTLTLNISVGVAMSGEDGHTFEALLEAADRRMYEDKYLRKVGQRPRAVPGIRLAHSSR